MIGKAARRQLVHAEMISQACAAVTFSFARLIRAIAFLQVNLLIDTVHFELKSGSRGFRTPDHSISFKPPSEKHKT